MRISFLSGPAGTGKTFRCLSEIRSELLARPEGTPLIFLAPKQSTYQLERQLLEDGLAGYSRLHILSFERLAKFLFEKLGGTMPNFISEQGRTMVLRALLTDMEDQLTIFRSAARRLGFAEEVSKQIREFQNHNLTPGEVRREAERIQPGHSSREKLRDLALIYERYLAWLEKQELEDGDALLTAATDLLDSREGTELEIGGIWFDGFAQLTPQELKLLVAALRFARNGTLAFCVDDAVDPSSKISSGYLVSGTVARCRGAIEQRYGKAVVESESLARDASRSRFRTSAALRHLERCWQSLDAYPDTSEEIRMVQAADPEAEALFVAREIVWHVRAGGRYRDAALLLRDLQNDYPHVLRRVFRRYEIPFFLDHRESVAHHPVAELTRGALRTIAFHFQHHDWFATLKSGLIRCAPEQIDVLENEALANGWQEADWRKGFALPKDPAREQQLNRTREKLIGPFVLFGNVLGARPRAEQLVEAIKALWLALSVEKQLDNWSQEDAGSAVHSTVWDQMEEWLNDLKRAFSGNQMSLTEWLPIIEAGLRNLTVGVVPPVLDQVLIGTVDRSRNPDLKTVFVLGLNERMFPAAPARDMILTDDDRDALREIGCTMGETPAARLAGEQFYGYIACTRPRERLVLSFARTSMDGAPLNPSRFLSQVKRLFPKVEVETFTAPAGINDVVHACELAALGLTHLGVSPASQLASPAVDEVLSPDLAHRLYGEELNISVSSLERFASCPYKFFLEQGLRLKERKEFLLDVREQGSFQHEVLANFHEELKRSNLKWRDLTPKEARERIARSADKIIPTFANGLLAKSEQNRFIAGTYKEGLQQVITALVEWFATNRFDPEFVELGFGGRNALPAWRMKINENRHLVLYGRIDRVDLCRISETEAICIVIDYKSGGKKPDQTLLHYGVQQQLPAYLLALTLIQEAAAHFQVERIIPAGCFYLPLSGKTPAKKSRREAHGLPDEEKRARYKHDGIFDLERLEYFDSSAPGSDSKQFKRRLNKDGSPRGGSFNALWPDDFAAVLDRSEELIREFGRRIYGGDIAIKPYKHGTQTPCDWCDFQSVCRFDPWTQPYHVLRKPEKAEPAEGAEG